MGDVRRGYVLLLTAGDREIAGALAEGVVKGREGCPIPLRVLPHCGGEAMVESPCLPAEHRRVVEAEIDRQRIARALRVAMHREPVDYEGLAFDAEVQYGESLYERGSLHWIAEKLLVGYALVVMGFERLFRAVGV